MCPHLFIGPYSSASPLGLYASNACPGSKYIRQLSEQMLISQENIKLLECIGQGRQVWKYTVNPVGTSDQIFWLIFVLPDNYSSLCGDSYMKICCQWPSRLTNIMMSHAVWIFLLYRGISTTCKLCSCLVVGLDASIFWPDPYYLRIMYVYCVDVFVLCERCYLVLHTCPLTGEFGIVYKARLSEMGTQLSLITVAVKTLKG